MHGFLPAKPCISRSFANVRSNVYVRKQASSTAAPTGKQYGTTDGRPGRNLRGKKSWGTTTLRGSQARCAVVGRRVSFALAQPHGFGTPGTFGVGGLGSRRQRFWCALLLTGALAIPYVTLIVSAARAYFDAPAAVVSIPAVSIPVAAFPQVAVPKLYRPVAPTSAPAATRPHAAPTTGRHLVRKSTTVVHRHGGQLVNGRHVVTRHRLPVTNSSYSLQPTPPSGGARIVLPGSAVVQGLAGALANAPVVTNTNPTPPPMPAPTTRRPANPRDIMFMRPRTERIELRESCQRRIAMARSCSRAVEFSQATTAPDFRGASLQPSAKRIAQEWSFRFALQYQQRHGSEARQVAPERRDDRH